MDFLKDFVRPRVIDYRFEGYYRIDLDGNDVEDLPYNVDTENHRQFMAKLINKIKCNGDALRRFCGWFRIFLVKEGEEEPISLLMRKFNLYVNAVHNGKRLFELGHKRKGAKFFVDVDFTGYTVKYKDLFGSSLLVGIQLGYGQVSISADVMYNNRHHPFKWKRAIGILVVTFPESARFVWINEDVTRAIEEKRVITLWREGQYGYITELPFYWGAASKVAREEGPYPWERDLDWYQPNKKTIKGIRTLLISVRYARAALHIQTMDKNPPPGYHRTGPRGGGGGDGGGGDGDGNGNGGPKTRHSGGRDGGSKPPPGYRRPGPRGGGGGDGGGGDGDGNGRGDRGPKTRHSGGRDGGSKPRFKRRFGSENSDEKLEKELIKNPPSSQEDGDVAWKLRGLAQMRKVDDSMARAMRVTSSPQEWRERGKKFFYENNFGMAIMCFERAGDTMWGKMAKASDLRASMMKFVHAFYYVESTRLFLRSLGCLSDLLLLEEELGQFLEAAELARSLGDVIKEADLKSDGSNVERSGAAQGLSEAALHVWKTIVVNTPKTLKEIMPVLMNTLIASLASPSSERRQAAGRALGELVRKLGERVLPLVIPILSKGLKDPDSSRRQGVCIGLSEVMASAGRSQLLSFMDELIPTIRTALCDSEVEVRESAGVAFSTLYKSAGMQAIDEIVPTLLHALEDDDMADTALDGLKQILSVRTAAVLPHILPKLVHLPLSAFNAHAAPGAVADVAGAGLNVHLSTVLPALLSAMGDDDHVDVQNLAKKAAETVVLVIDDEGIEYMISELLKGVGDSQASTRRSSAYLIGYFFKNSKLYLVDEAPTMISTLIVLLSDTDSATVLAAWEALARVVSSVPKEVLPSYIKLVRDAVSTSRDKERRKKKGGPIVIPGLCLPKALQPLLPIYLQGLISGSPEVREQAAQGLGELIEVTSEKALKEFVIPITGPLIRIIGDRFPWQVKSAILSTLTIIIAKGGMALKPFLPQLQTTFVKCLQDSTRTVRSSAASALGKLSALSTRVDPLVGDLLSNLQASDGGVREAILAALKGVVKHAGKSVSAPVKTRVYDLLKEMIYNDDDQIRSSSARILGIISEYLEEDQISELPEELPEKASSPSWSARHGSVLTISSMLRHIPAVMSASPLFTAVSDCLKNCLKDEKFPVRETSTKALGRLLHQIQKDPSNTNAHKGTAVSIASAMQDDSSEVRRRALFALKAVSKANPSVVMIHVTVYGPALVECLKDGSTPVRLAAERCALHALQLTKGTENVQAAQKYITGLDARRISKLSEYSDDSDDSEDDSASG